VTYLSRLWVRDTVPPRFVGYEFVIFFFLWVSFFIRLTLKSPSESDEFFRVLSSFPPYFGRPTLYFCAPFFWFPLFLLFSPPLSFERFFLSFRLPLLILVPGYPLFSNRSLSPLFRSLFSLFCSELATPPNVQPLAFNFFFRKIPASRQTVFDPFFSRC